jgi:pyruvate dehydrogenase E2 component (dihydrolipoamide acetyltransferase)
MPFEAEADGILHIVVQAGETAAVGETIARIAPEGVDPAALAAGDGAAGPAAPGDGPAGPAAAGDADAAPRAADGAAGRRADGAGAAAGRPAGARVSASPVARRIARELGVDLAGIAGSGPHGRIVKRDVLAAHAAGTERGAGAGRAAAPDATTAGAGATAAETARPAIGPAGTATAVPLSRVQQVIARRMTEAKTTAPDFALDVEIDMGAALALRERLKERLAGSERPVPTVGDFVIKACGLALREHPRANGAFRGDHVELFDRVNIGVAVAAGEALYVPTVFDADQRSLGQIAADVRRLAAAAREGRLTAAELEGATFTVSNLGMFGIDAFTAVLNPPQAAILAVGAVRERPVARDGRLVLGQTMVARLTCDHRILNGADGAALLVRVRELLETPELLLL